MDSLKAGANYVSEAVQQATSGASKEANKNVAVDGNASLTSRATAAKDAVIDKTNESAHKAKSEVHKEEVKH